MRATSEHRSELARLLAVQLREHRVPIPEDSLREAIDGVLADPARGFFMVLELDQRIVGAAYVSFVWALEHGGRAGWLEELYVEPDHRADGLGTSLLRAVLSECRSLGCAAVDLEIDADHARVCSLYERHDFEALPRRRLVKRLLDGPVETRAAERE